MRLFKLSLPGKLSFALSPVRRIALKPDHPILVVADYYATSGYDHGPADQVRILGHQADCFALGGRIILHPLFLECLAARIQEILVVVFANQFLKFGGAQAILDQVAIMEMEAALLQEMARLTASGAGGLLQELNRFLGFPGSRRGRLACGLLHLAFSLIIIALERICGGGNSNWFGKGLRMG